MMTLHPAPNALLIPFGESSTAKVLDGSSPSPSQAYLGSIFQNVDALDIIRREVIDISTWHTVNHIQRGVGTYRTHTTDYNLVTLTRLSGVHDNVHT